MLGEEKHGVLLTKVQDRFKRAQEITFLKSIFKTTYMRDESTACHTAILLPPRLATKRLI